MMISPAKIRIFAAAGAFVLISAFPAFAQEKSPPPEPEDDPLQERSDESGENTGRSTIYLGPGRVPDIERDPATGRPRSIMPGPYVAPGSLSRSFDASPDAADGNPADGLRQPDQGLEIGELDQLDPAAVGLIDQAGGGFSPAMWRGTARASLELLLPRLPGAVPSPAQNDLQRRLLLSSASIPPPAGAGDMDSSSLHILETRLDRIAAGGDLRGLLGLLERIPLQFDSPKIRRIKADAFLLDGNAEDACNVAERARSEDASPFWLQLTAFCQAIDGNQTGASLTVDLLQETGDAPALFAELIDRILFEISNPGAAQDGNIGGLFDLFTPDPLNIAMMRAAGVEMPPGIQLNVPPLTLGALARAPNLSLDRRADAALAAARLGVIGNDTLMDIFAAMEFSEEERALAETLAETDLGARIDGLLFHAASLESDPARRLQLLGTAWRRAAKDGTHAALAPAFATLIAPLEPAAAQIPFAHETGRILLFSGQTREAKEWYDLARGLAARSNIEATKALVDLWPLMIVADSNGSTPFSSQILSLWAQGQAVLPPEERAKRAGLFFGILEALGYEVPEAMWDEALSSTARENNAPSLATWRRLLQASNDRRFGETVLLSLIAIGGEGPGKVNPSALTTAINALAAAGLEADARKLALEALIANGF